MSESTSSLSHHEGSIKILSPQLRIPSLPKQNEVEQGSEQHFVVKDVQAHGTGVGLDDSPGPFQHNSMKFSLGPEIQSRAFAISSSGTFFHIWCPAFPQTSQEWKCLAVLLQLLCSFHLIHICCSSIPHDWGGPTKHGTLPVIALPVSPSWQIWS